MNNLFFFWGQESFLINSEIEKIKTKNIDKNFETMAYKKIYKPSISDITTILGTLPMMFGNVMHVIDVNDFFLSDSGSSVDDWELKQFEKALETKSEKNIIVFRLIIPPDSKKKVDTRKKIYKITAKYAEEKQFPFLKPTSDELTKIISELGKNVGLKLNSGICKELISQIGTNVGILNSELQKLAITIYPKNEPTSDDIKDICVQKNDVFSILEPVLKNDLNKGLTELKKVFEKSSCPEIMGALQYSLRNLAYIKIYYPKIGASGIFQKTHIPNFIIDMNYKMISKVSIGKIINLKQNLTKAEYKIKSGECTNPEYAIEMALMGVNDVQ